MMTIWRAVPRGWVREVVDSVVVEMGVSGWSKGGEV